MSPIARAIIDALRNEPECIAILRELMQADPGDVEPKRDTE